MGSVSPLLAEYGPAFVQALLLTWKLTVLSFVAGFALGIVITVARLLPLRPLRLVLTLYVEVFRNIPSVALLIFIVFALPDLNVLIDYEPAVVLTLVLVCSAFTADYLRTGINTIAGGQIEAALSLGMRPMQVITAVVLPLNLFTGFFGMNFEHLPLIHSTEGMWVALALLALLAGGILAIFWRRRYLTRTGR